MIESLMYILGGAAGVVALGVVIAVAILAAGGKQG